MGEIIMKVQIISQKKNPLTKSERVLLRVEHSKEATPNREKIWEEVSKTLKKNKELIIIDKITTLKGFASSEVKALVYSKKEDIPKYKAEKMKKRIEKLKKTEAKEEKQAEPEKEQETKGKEQKTEEKEDAKPEEKQEKETEEEKKE